MCRWTLDLVPDPGETPVPKRVLATGILVLLSTAAPTALTARESTRALDEATAWQMRTLDKLQKRSHYMERVMHTSLSKVNQRAKSRLRRTSTPRKRYRILIALWKRVYTRTSVTYHHPPFLAALTCIHHGEGTWNEMRNPFYDGGLQMNFTFEERYGNFLLRRKGRAYNWTPLEQIWTAVYAIRGPDHRGFYPWPTTARICNLI
jgi:hypothetical protein